MNATTLSLPDLGTRRRKIPWWVIPLVALLVAGGGVLWYRPWSTNGKEPVTGQFYTVQPIDLEVKVNKDGELQAISYTDVKSDVEGISQIIELVPEGSYVNKGDVLVRLDSTNLSTRKEALDLEIKKAESMMKISQELRSIQENQNSANLEVSQVALELAELDLKQYVEGIYPQQLQNARTAQAMAEITLKNRQEELSQTRALFEKGFVTATDVKKAELDVTVSRNDLNKAQTAMSVLEKYAHPMDMARLKSAAAQAEQRLNRTRRYNTSEMAQRDADLAQKVESLGLLNRQMEKLTEQIAACEIKAPEDGLVIYSSSIDRSMREPIQEGTTVRLSQWLIRLPNVKTMKAVLKIQEAMKPKLDESKGQRALVKILGVPDPVGATLTKVSVLPDNSQRWWNPDLREYPVELTLDKTPPGLKPGVRVENAEIFISREEKVLAVPLGALYTVGRDCFVFVKEGDSVKERKVLVSTANETHVMVQDGLTSGDQVLLLAAGQGRQLLEKAGVAVREVPSQRPPQVDPKQPLPPGGRRPQREAKVPAAKDRKSSEVNRKGELVGTVDGK